MLVTLEQLPEQWGALLGVPGLTWDEGHRLFLSCEGLLVLVAATKRTLRLSSRVGDLPVGNDRSRLLEALLAANHFFCLTGGAALAMAPQSGEIWLHRDLPFHEADLDPVRVHTDFEAFVETAADWFDRLNPAESDVLPSHPETPYA